MAAFNELIQSETPTLIQFHATWCQPCKMLAPMVEEAKRHMGDKVRVLKIDIDRNQALASQLGIQSVPTLMLYRAGKQEWRKSGVIPAEAIVKKLQEFAS